MPRCNQCGQRIQSGRLCQTCTLADREGDDVDVDQESVDDDPIPVECTACGHRYDHVGQACPECGARRRRHVDDDQDDEDDQEWSVDQLGLDGSRHEGQATLAGGVAKDGGER